MKGLHKKTIFWVIVLSVLVLAVWLSTRSSSPSNVMRPNLSEFQSLVDDGKVKSARINDSARQVRGTVEQGSQVVNYVVNFPNGYSTQLVNELSASNVPVSAERGGSSWVTTLLVQVLPLLILFGIFLFFLSSMGGGGRGVMAFGKAKPKLMNKDDAKITFSDVAGVDEAIEELEEIKEFLESPAKFHAIGAKIPKGVLLFGPPGTGKTLLARAVAGEAGVPFFSISGSDFVEMFVGVGASRVRDLFEQAKASAPCIIFMDEIDAVGRHRGGGMGGGHDEREQTLNQLLVEMDGFDPRTGIILIAATNRPDVLDPALLRPGRFDRQITVDRPDIEGRKSILKVHTADKPLATDVTLDILARRTPGFTGADLANLVNEAALIAARHSAKEISMKEMEHAIDRVIGGPERKNRVMSDEEKRIIAYHEGGHALVGHVLPDANPVHKVSIIARGRALGWTLSIPEEDRNIVARIQLKAEMAVAMGGRVAEEVIFDEPSTGASNDIEKLTEMARAMVTQYGMSDELGPQLLGNKESDSFLGRSSMSSNYGGEIAGKIDSEVRRLVDEAHETAYQIITTHRDALDTLADMLIQKETADAKDLDDIWGHLPSWGEKLTGERRKDQRRSTQRRKTVKAVGAGAEKRSEVEDRRDAERRTPAKAKTSVTKKTATKRAPKPQGA